MEIEKYGAGGDGRYQILKKLASGGSGDAFLVQDTRLGCQRVLKRITLGCAGAREAALCELSALGQLHKEGIPMLTDVYREAGAICLVMEYMNGITLEEKIRCQGAMAEGEAVACAWQIAEFLRFLHSRPGRLVHGDLKPANLIWQEGRIALLDFGAAVFLQQDTAPAAKTECRIPENRCLTPGYGAPELWEGYPPSVKTDIYAFGAVLFFLVTGESPAAPRGIYPVREQNPFLSKPLQQFILGCTRKQPENRYTSAEEIEEELKKLSMGKKGWRQNLFRRREPVFRCVKNILLSEPVLGETPLEASL